MSHIPASKVRRLPLEEFEDMRLLLLLGDIESEEPETSRMGSLLSAKPFCL